MDFPLHEEVVSPSPLRALRAVAPTLRAWGFYLAGGTAVALYYGHRRSMDLDWFRSEPFDPLLLHAGLREAHVPLKSASFAPHTLIASVRRTKVSFFAYPYPLLAPLRNWETYGVSIAAPEDLVCMKLVAIQQCGSKRDFFDLYMLLQDIPLQRAVELYAQKHGVQPNASLAYALTYFSDADSEPNPRMRVRLSWRTVKRFMQQQALALLQG